MQSVTLGGTGKAGGDRHPKVREGVLIGAGAKVMGNIEIGACSPVGAGGVVLKPVPPRKIGAGDPAQVAGGRPWAQPARSMAHTSSPSQGHTAHQAGPAAESAQVRRLVNWGGIKAILSPRIRSLLISAKYSAALGQNGNANNSILASHSKRLPLF